MSTPYIKSMSGSIQRQRHYGAEGFELVVTVSFDAKQFSAIRKRKQDPLREAMGQIKNVVFDACGVQGHPSYSRPSMNQHFPRASKGLVTLKLTFEVDMFILNRLKVNTKEWCLYHKVDLQETLEATRDEGHLFAKTALMAAVRGGA